MTETTLIERWKKAASNPQTMPALAIATVGQMTPEEKQEAADIALASWEACIAHQPGGASNPLCIALLQIWAELMRCLAVANSTTEMAQNIIDAGYRA